VCYKIAATGFEEQRCVLTALEERVQFLMAHQERVVAEKACDKDLVIPGKP